MSEIPFTLLFETLSYIDPIHYLTLMCTSSTLRQRLNQKDYLLYLVNNYYSTNYAALSESEIFELIWQKSTPLVYNLTDGLLHVYNCRSHESKNILLADKSVCRTGSVWIMYNSRLLVTGGIHRKD